MITAVWRIRETSDVFVAKKPVVLGNCSGKKYEDPGKTAKALVQNWCTWHAVPAFQQTQTAGHGWWAADELVGGVEES